MSELHAKLYISNIQVGSKLPNPTPLMFGLKKEWYKSLACFIKQLKDHLASKLLRHTDIPGVNCSGNQHCGPSTSYVFIGLQLFLSKPQPYNFTNT